MPKQNPTPTVAFEEGSATHSDQHASTSGTGRIQPRGLSEPRRRSCKTPSSLAKEKPDNPPPGRVTKKPSQSRLKSGSAAASSVAPACSAGRLADALVLHELAASRANAIEVLAKHLLKDPERDARLIGGWLDVPEGSTFWPAMRVAGWVVSRDPLADVSVHIIADSCEWIARLVIERPDVLTAKMLPENHLRCGFSILIPLLQTPKRLAVRLKIDGIFFHWWEVELGDSPKPDPTFVAWTALLGRPLDGFDVPAEQFASKSTGMLINSQISFSDSASLQSSALGDEQKVFMHSLFQEYSASSLAESMLSEAIETKSVLSRTRWRGLGFRLAASHCYRDSNLLFFSSGELVYVVIQYSWSAVGLYVPLWGVLLSWTSWEASLMLQPALADLLSSPDAFIYKGIDRPDRKFTGVIVGNERPYHFYYDQLPVIFAVPGASAQRIFQLSKFSFFPLAGLIPGSVEMVESSEVNEVLARCNGFALMAGYHAEHNSGIPDVLRKIHDNVLERQRPSPNISSHFPVLWLGVSSQKRVWKEQIQGLAYLITGLLGRFPGMAVVFDGWTSPLNPSKDDDLQVRGDRHVVQEIINKCPRFPYFDVIGASSLEKIAMASQCDYFVSNWLQGSLHIDNIARKHGVGHFNTHWCYYEKMYHHNYCVRITDDLIKDGYGESEGCVSYSIDPAHVLDAILRVMDDIPLSKIRPLTNFRNIS